MRSFLEIPNADDDEEEEEEEQEQEEEECEFLRTATALVHRQRTQRGRLRAHLAPPCVRMRESGSNGKFIDVYAWIHSV